MKSIIPIFLLVFNSFLIFSQNQGEIKGTVKDAVSDETIIGATVLIAEGKGGVTDINGNYSIKADSGQYVLTVSYVGYEAQKLKIKVGSKPVTFNFSLQSKTLNEVEVVADVAKIRETPVAFSNITAKQIQEELGTRDLPMVLNSTPGVYATEQGGGSGDARVSIRGFDQRNVAVMVDGVPVNDMENGQVYWSNWDGLGDITRSMQVQRGLGASKLAIASVGGTINIITKGIDEKFGVSVKQEVNNYGLYKTSFGFNSGPLKNGWGVTLGGARKWGNGWADATFDDAWSYFFKVQKRFKNQLFSFSASGAPQSHGQRSTPIMPIAIYSKSLAQSLGINTDSVYSHSDNTTGTQGERGLRYNSNWGNLNGSVFNEKINYFHKPQFNLSHFWTPTEKLNVSTVLYLSIGKGGGTALKNITSKDTATGQLDIQSIYNYNSTNISSTYSTTEHVSSNYQRAANNDHIWYGVLSTWNYKINDHLSALAGVDGRYYKGTHYQTVYNLIGGDYTLDFTDKNQPFASVNKAANMKRVGDKVGYYNDAIVMWGGAFAQVEYKKEKWSTFLTGSISQTGYQRIDYFKKKDLVLADTTIQQAVGYGDTLSYKGTRYTNQSAEARFATTPRLWFLGYTIKGGANYNINDNHNVFLNLGYLNMAPRLNLVFDNNNKKFLDIQNQKVYAIEIGYGLKHPKYAANLNFYYTLWRNKPPAYTPTVPDPNGGGTLSYNINGLDALHKGIELDFIYKVLENLDVEGIASIGDWKTVSGAVVNVTNDLGQVVQKVDFSAKDIHVGDAAQIQIGGGLRYTIVKNLYIKPRFTYFGKNYANFDPLTLVGTNKDRESWKMPSYNILDIYAGYDFSYRKLKYTLTAGVVNALDAVYITDGQNGMNFDANTAVVFMGMGRRYNVALKIAF